MGVTRREITYSGDRDGRLKELEVTEAPQDSLEVSVNAKGEPSWSLKVYGNDPTDIAARARALRELAEKHAHEIRDKKGAA